MPVPTIWKGENFYFEKKWLSYYEAEDNCKEKGGELFKPEYIFLDDFIASEKVIIFRNYKIGSKTFSGESFWIGVSTKNPDENEYCVQMVRHEKFFEGEMPWGIAKGKMGKTSKLDTACSLKIPSICKMP